MTNKPRLDYLAHLMTLFFVVMTIYLLSYRGLFLVRDEHFLYDSTESLVRQGNLLRTYEYNSRLDGSTTVVTQPDGTPWRTGSHEPLMPILVAPLLWLAQQFNDVGTMHIVWLFNAFITAFVACSIYAIGVLQGYARRRAWIVAFLFAVGTIAWAYSRLLFREPLMALFTVWSFYFASRLRSDWEINKINWQIVGLFIASVIAMLLTKVIAIIFFPGIIIVLLPSTQLIRSHYRLLAIVTIAIMLAMIGIVSVFSVTDLGIERYSFQNYWNTYTDNIRWESILESFLGYLISPGRSIWLYNPILILAIPGGWLLIKRGEWRIVAAAILTHILVSLFYGFSLNVDWWGGWGWGPRYLLPLIPVLMLFLLPLFDHLDQLWRKLTVIFIALLSIVIQLIGNAVPIENYFTDRYFSGHAPFGAIDPWMAFNWQWRWSPIPYHFSNVDFKHLDVAWTFAEEPWRIIVLFVILLALNSFIFLMVSRHKIISKPVLISIFGISTILLITGTSLGIKSLSNDARYIQDQDDVMTLLNDLDDVAQADDAIFLDRAEYTLMFMNYFKTPALFVTLPYAPGEVYGPEGPAVTSDDLAILMGEESQYALDWTADHYEHIWLIASSSPFQPEKVRPIEHYLVERYFPVHEIELDGIPVPRAIQFLTTDAPMGEPTIEINAAFGELLSLNGIDLPDGTTFRAGDGIPISLSWQPVDNIDFNYNIGIYLVGPNGVETDRNGQPQGTFGNMMEWEIGETYRDNHGLIVPEDTPSGQYQLLLAVYNWQDGQRLTAISDSVEVIDNALLLATITIE